MAAEPWLIPVPETRMMETENTASASQRQMSSSSATDGSATVGKPLDARLFDRPSGFDGEVRRWPSCRLKFEAWLTMVDVEFGHWIKEARLANFPVPWSTMSSRA